MYTPSSSAAFICICEWLDSVCTDRGHRSMSHCAYEKTKKKKEKKNKPYVNNTRNHEHIGFLPLVLSVVRGKVWLAEPLFVCLFGAYITEGWWADAGNALKLWGAAWVWSLQHCLARKPRGRRMRLERRTYRERFWWGPVRVARAWGPSAETGPDQWLLGAHNRFQTTISRVGGGGRGRGT